MALLFEDEYKQLLNEIKTKELVIELSEFDKMWKEVLDINNNKLLIGDTNTVIAELSRRYIIEYYYFSMAVCGDLSNELQIILRPLLVSIANTAFCIYKNAYDGFKYQTKVLLRNLYEQGLVLLNVLLDKEKRSAILSSASEKNTYKTWRKYFTPQKMHDTIKRFEEKLGEAWSEDWHMRIYGDLSSYTHNDFLSFFVGSYYVSEDEEMQINICGGFADHVDELLEQMNAMLFFFGMNFLKILVNGNSDVTKEMICADDKDTSKCQEFWNKATFLELLNRKCFLKLFWEKNAKENAIQP